MKKSYLALGLVAAVAMSSCSNDEPLVNPQNPAQGLEPIKLSLTTTVADVNVGTRGTGTVGGMDVASNKWQYENIYVLMTSTQDRIDDDTDNPTWGFTSAMGEGPFLKEQFNGEFWARPVEGGDGENATSLNYYLDKNEWWNDAPINKYYPQKGESQFFAYYIDDAATTNATQLSYMAAPDGVNTQTATPHAFPVINPSADGLSKTVDFTINGTQDLMAGVATSKDATTGTDVIASFSAKTARQGVIPSITMKHLLSRLTFNILRGAESTKMVTLDAIRIKSKSKGTMTVAYEKDHAPAEVITWDAAETDFAEFILHEKVIGETVKTNDDGFVVDAGGANIQATVKYSWEEYDDTNPAHTGLTPETYGTKEYVKIVGDLDVDVKYDNSLGTHGYRVDLGRGFEWLISNTNIDASNYTAFTNEVIIETLPNASLADGKKTLTPMASIDLGKAFTYGITYDEQESRWEDAEGNPVADPSLKLPVGEAMFVKPGVEKYKMFIDMTVKVRNYGDVFEGVDPNDYTSSELTEKVTTEFDIVLPKNASDEQILFEAGKSYAINITIYGMEKIVVKVVPQAWVDGGEINIGGDDDAENGDYTEPTPAP